MHFREPHGLATVSECMPLPTSLSPSLTIIIACLWDGVDADPSPGCHVTYVSPHSDLQRKVSLHSATYFRLLVPIQHNCALIWPHNLAKACLVVPCHGHPCYIHMDVHLKLSQLGVYV